MSTVSSTPDQPACPTPEPQPGNTLEFDLSEPEHVAPVPFVDLVMHIPGIKQPYVGYDGAISKALKNLDPTRGLLCVLRPYLGMAEFDYIEVFWGNDTTPAAFTTLTKAQADNGSSIPLYVPEAWLQYGAVFPCFFKVTPTVGSPDETTRFSFFIDDYEPGGQDHDYSTPYHDNLDAPEFEQHIVDDGVTPEDAALGVPVKIPYYPNRTGLSPRYNRAARDTIWLSLNGHTVTQLVTETEAAGTDPIVITVNSATWDIVGSGDVVAQYFVIDEAGNRTVAPSRFTIIQSLIGDPNPLLNAPFIQEVNHLGQVDVDLLAGQPATLVINVPGNGYLTGDVIAVEARGYTADGSPIVKQYTGTISSVFVNLLIPVPFADLQTLVGGSLRIRFERIRAGVNPNRRSRVNVMDVIGSPVPVKLPPARILGAPDGNIPADAATVSVLIYEYPGQDEFDALLLMLTGTYANGANYYREIGPRPAGTGDIQINITNGPNGDIAQLEGGTLDVRYQATNEHGIRPSEVASFSVGALVPSLPVVSIDEAPPPDYLFNPTVSLFGATVTVPSNAAFTVGSTVTLHFEGSVANGSWSKPFPITSVWVGVDLPFEVPRGIVVANLNASAKVHYTLKKPAERDRFSHHVDMRVGTALDLPVPEILGATVVVPGQSATLNPLQVAAGTSFTIRVRYNMLTGDLIQPYFRGKAGLGYPTISPQLGNPISGYVDFTVANTAVAANVESHVPVDYLVSRGGAHHPSHVLDLEVQAIPSSALQVVSVPEAVGGEIDANVSNRVEALQYPFMRAGQAFWIDLDGVTDHALRRGTAVSPAEVSAGLINAPIPASYLGSLPNASALEVKARVSLDGTGMESSAVAFSVPRYVTKRPRGIVKTIGVGAWPMALAFNFDQSQLYVANSFDGTLSVIDTQTNSVVKTISGFNGPTCMVLHPDGTRLFVGNSGSTGVKVVNTSTNTIIQTILGSGAIRGIALDQNGINLYVSFYRVSSQVLAIHNANTGALLNTLNMPSPGGMGFAPNRNRLYAPHVGGITIVNTSGNGSVVTTIPANILEYMDANSTAFGLHPLNANKVYIRAEQSIIILDSDTNTISQISDPLTGYGMAANPITQRVYFGGLNTVSIIDTSVDRIIDAIYGFNTVYAIVVSRDGLFMYVCNAGIGVKTVSLVAL